MTTMVIMPSITPKKGKVSGVTNFNENGESRFAKVETEATLQEWLQSKTKLGYAIIGDCLVHVTALHTMGITIDEKGETYATLPFKGDKAALIPLNKRGEVRIV